MPALASQPARPVCVCVFFEQRRRRRSPLLVVAHYQVGRSIGRRRARAQRAHHSFDGRSRARRARLAAMRAPAKVVTTQYLSSIDCAGLLGAPAVQRAWSGCVVAAEHAPHPPGHAGPRNQRRRCSAYCFLI